MGSTAWSIHSNSPSATCSTNPRTIPLCRTRFAFEKFPQADPTLTTQMKSVGEAMAIGRTFKESLRKCLRSLEIGRRGLGEE